MSYGNCDMKILYDYQILYNQKYGGISRYYYELINTIEELKLATTDISCKFSANHYFADYNGIKEGTAFLDFKSAIVRRPLRLFGHLMNRSITKKRAKDADIIHLTYYNPYALDILGVKKVVTVYDMIEEVKRKDASLDQVIANKKECIQKADHVIAISESTKRDILRLYPDVSEEKISVIYIGTSMKGADQSEIEQGQTKKDRGFPDRYILYVGQRGGYKNFEGFMRAVKTILGKDRTLNLVCIGGGKFTSREIAMMSGIESQVLQMDADDQTLISAYSNAAVFVFPSLYEGFGIPTLEAFTCNCPAVISNTSSMLEVGGEAVLYFDPEDGDEMRGQIERALEDKILRFELVKKGRERLKQFSWETIARQTVDCYKKVLGDG